MASKHTTAFPQNVLFLGYVPLQPGEPACSAPGTPAGYRVETEAEAIKRLGYDPATADGSRGPDHIGVEVTHNKADRSMVITLTAKTEVGAWAIKRMRGEETETSDG